MMSDTIKAAVQDRPTTRQVVPSPTALTIGLSQEEHDLLHQLRSLASQLPTGWGSIVATIEVRDRAFTRLTTEVHADIVLGDKRRQSANASYQGAKR